MQIRPTNSLKWRILSRIQRLPFDQIGLVRRLVMHRAKCSQSKYYRVIQEKDNDVHVIIALAQVLGCKVDDVITPTYVFRDPKFSKDQVDRLTREGYAWAEQGGAMPENGKSKAREY